jgi:hypothetical protein
MYLAGVKVGIEDISKPTTYGLHDILSKILFFEGLALFEIKIMI